MLWLFDPFEHFVARIFPPPLQHPHSFGVGFQNLLLGDGSDELKVHLEAEVALVKRIASEISDFSVVFKHRLIVGLRELKVKVVVAVEVRGRLVAASPGVEKVDVGVREFFFCGLRDHSVKALQNVLDSQLVEPFQDFHLQVLSLIDELLAYRSA